MNLRGWNANGSAVTLTATSNVTTVSSYEWSAKFDFEVEHPATPVTPARPVADGAYRVSTPLSGAMAVSAAEDGCALSESAAALDFAYDEATGLYSIASAGKALTESGRYAVLAEPDGSPSQRWRVEARGGGYTLTSATGLALDDYGRGTAEGNLFWLYEPNGSPAQVWTLENELTNSHVG
ncbi:RICIN domain-containing protein [Senegalimassilia anaerobia]